MSVTSTFNQIHEILRCDEQLVRLLFYKAENSKDDVLVVSKERPNIVGRLISNDIVSRIFKAHELTEEHLSNDDPQCCCAITLGDFDNVANTGTNNINPYLYEQKFNVDIYAHENFQNIDMRLNKLLDCVLGILNPKVVIGLGKVRFVSSSKLDGIPNYEGMRITFAFKYSVI